MTWWHKKDFYRHKTYRTFHRRCHQECRQLSQDDKRLPGKPRSPHCQKRDSPREPSAGSTWSAFGRDSNPAFERQGWFRTNRFSLSLKSLEAVFHFGKKSLRWIQISNQNFEFDDFSQHQVTQCVQNGPNYSKKAPKSYQVEHEIWYFPTKRGSYNILNSN